VGESASHEIGHTLGLQHQSIYDSNCAKTAEYSTGQGTGEIGWAPIMGVGYYKNFTTWHTGTNTINCSTIQSDLSVISGSPNNFGFRSDDYGNTAQTAHTVAMSGINFSITGIVNQPGDRDAFKISTTASGQFKLNATPDNVGTGDNGANVDIKISLLDSNADTLAQYNPATLLDAGIDTFLNQGSYYLVVDGVGNVNHSSYGSLGLYALSGTVGSALSLRIFDLHLSTDNNQSTLSWDFQADERVKNFVVEAAEDGSSFAPIATISPDARTFSYQPGNSQLVQFRIQAVLENGAASYYSNIVILKNTNKLKDISLLKNVISDRLTVTSNRNYNYQLIDLSGRILNKGQLQQGINDIQINNAFKGMLLLHWTDGNVQGTEKIIKL